MENQITTDFDRIFSALSGLPDTRMSRPRTILETYPLVHEKNATFVVQTHKAKDQGFTIFLTIVDAQGSRRIVIPPKIAGAIFAQRQNLLDRSTPESRRRRAASTAAAKRRKEKADRSAAYAARNGAKE